MEAGADRGQQLRQFEGDVDALDSDQAGDGGAERIALQLGRPAVRVQLPAGVKDVAELAATPGGEHRFRAALRAATDCASAHAA